jgi:tripartite-type tricarboxylate transporter receptor subunit TctC
MGTHVVNGAYYTSLPFDLLNDFAPVAMIASNPQVIVSHLSVPARNLKELIPFIKANQKQVLIGTGGIGGASHMAGIYFLNRIGAKLEFVPYRGGARRCRPSYRARSASTSAGFERVGFTRAKRIRAYAVTAPNRQDAAPEIPTVDEAGLPGLHTAVWHGIWAPKATPRDVVMKLNAAIVETLADKPTRQRFADLGQEIPNASSRPRKRCTPTRSGDRKMVAVDPRGRSQGRLEGISKIRSLPLPRGGLGGDGLVTVPTPILNLPPRGRMIFGSPHFWLETFLR